jgi:hemerythrin
MVSLLILIITGKIGYLNHWSCILITWDQSLSTGDERTDSQHLVLIDKLNEFDAVISGSNSGDIRRAAGEVLDFLQFYAAWHFQQEEAVMAKMNCPAAEQNKLAHAKFIGDFGRFYSQWQTSSMDLGLARKTYEQLRDWVVDHILTIDVQMKDCVQ